MASERAIRSAYDRTGDFEIGTIDPFYDGEVAGTLGRPRHTSAAASIVSFVHSADVKVSPSCWICIIPGRGAI